MSSFEIRPHRENDSLELKKEEDDLHSNQDNTSQDPPDVISPSEEDEDDSQTDDDDDDDENASNQLVIYDHVVNGTANEIVPMPDPLNYRAPSYSPIKTRGLPSVGAFTVQCANCFKWRLIPRKEKYEEIREHILENPFVCDMAREWRPDISCDDPADIHQDGSRLWAIDKPNIAQPPPGWERLLRIRAEGGSKFADVYYVAPTGKRLRSMVEIERYLSDHPEFVCDAVQPSQFSFQTPKPLQENYVRKRPSRVIAPDDRSHLELTRPLEPTEVNLAAWEGPSIDSTDLQLGGPGLSSPHLEPPVFDHVSPPSKKQASTVSSFQHTINDGNSSL